MKFSDTVKEIETLVNSLDTIGEIKAVYQIYKERFDILRKRAVTTFEVGDKVKFTHKGNTIMGEVNKINRKTVGVKESDSYRTWRVGPSILEKVD